MTEQKQQEQQVEQQPQKQEQQQPAEQPQPQVKPPEPPQQSPQQQEQPPPQPPAETPKEAELRQQLASVESRLAEYKQKLSQFEAVVSGLIKSEIEPLPEAERNLITELAGGDDPLEQLRVLRVLKAQGKIAITPNPISRPDASADNKRPNSLEDARRAVIKALNS